MTKGFTNELKEVFDYINNVLIKQYDTDIVTIDYFILAALVCRNSVANTVMSKILFDGHLEEIRKHYEELVKSQSKVLPAGTRSFDVLLNKCVEESSFLSDRCKTNDINSAYILYCILKNDEVTSNYFKSVGVTCSQIILFLRQTDNNSNDTVNDEENNKPIKHKKKPKRNNEMKNIVKIIQDQSDMMSFGSGGKNETERNFENVNERAINGEIEEFLFGNEKYDEMFEILLKRNKNNVAVVGASGVGKTLFVENLANLIVNNKCPKIFEDKILMKVNFYNLFSGTSMRGVFEARVETIIEEARRNGNYIFFIDNLSQSINSNFSKTDMEAFVDRLLEDKDIIVILTCSDKSYSNEIMSSPKWNGLVTKLELNECNNDEATEILKNKSEILKVYHDVDYEEDIFSDTVKMCKRYLTDRSLPDSAIEILDRTSAGKTIHETTPQEIIDLRNELKGITEQRLSLSGSVSDVEFDAICRNEIEVRNKLEKIEKDYYLNKKPPIVTFSDIKRTLSKMTGIPLDDLSVDDKQKLMNLNSKMKQSVIGQDEAVDEVCGSVKRQRVGISNPNKPVVFLFTGHTGVGKTYLAKNLAKELFGDEKNLVRLDMTEYADKTSATKLIGTGAGYIGFENGGILTEAIKKKKHCVLLLDEIEKANDEVNNVLLPMFDEGRLTDNKGYVVDFKNVIVIMTSNVGAARVEESGSGIGFVKNETNLARDIIEKEMRKKFRPEFINRIDKIIYFNKLTNDNIRNIICMEIEKVHKRICDLGYEFDDTILNGILVDEIYDIVSKEEKYGARPVLRAIQNKLEDKLTDYIIEHNVEKGHIFTYNEINS